MADNRMDEIARKRALENIEKTNSVENKNLGKAIDSLTASVTAQTKEINKASKKQEELTKNVSKMFGDVFGSFQKKLDSSMNQKKSSDKDSVGQSYHKEEMDLFKKQFDELKSMNTSLKALTKAFKDESDRSEEEDNNSADFDKMDQKQREIIQKETFRMFKEMNTSLGGILKVSRQTETVQAKKENERKLDEKMKKQTSIFDKMLTALTKKDGFKFNRSPQDKKDDKSPTAAPMATIAKKGFNMFKLLAGLGLLGAAFSGIFTGEWGPFSQILVQGGKTLLTMFTKFGALIPGGKLLSSIGGAILTPLKSIGAGLIGFLGKGLGKLGIETGAKGAGGILAKGLTFLKKTPLGVLISIPFAIGKFKKGDMIGGLLELASGGLSAIPGVGTVLSIALSMFTAFRDIKMKDAELKGLDPKKVDPMNGVMDWIKGVFGKVWDGVKNFGANVVEKIKSFFKKDEKTGESPVKVFGDMISEKLKNIGSFLGRLPLIALENLQGLFNKNKDDINSGDKNPIIDKVMVFFEDKVMGIFNIVKELPGKVIDFAKGFFIKDEKTDTSMFDTMIVEPIINFLVGIGDALYQLPATIASATQMFFTKDKDTGTSMFDRVYKIASDWLWGVGETLFKLPFQLVDFITTMFTGKEQTGAEDFAKTFFDGFSSFMRPIQDFFVNIGGQIYAWVGELFNKDPEETYGQQMKQVILDPMIESIKTIWDWIMGIPGQIGESFKDVGGNIAEFFGFGGKDKSIEGKATGGVIGNGFPINRSNGDNVLITAKTGEVVLNSQQQQAIGGDQVFRDIGVPGFANGGKVKREKSRAGDGVKGPTSKDSLKPRDVDFGGRGTDAKEIEGGVKPKGQDKTYKDSGGSFESPTDQLNRVGNLDEVIKFNRKRDGSWPNFKDVNPEFKKVVEQLALHLAEKYGAGSYLQINDAKRGSGDHGAHGAGFAVDTNAVLKGKRGDGYVPDEDLKQFNLHRPLLKWKDNQGGPLNEGWHIEPFPGEKKYGSARNKLAPNQPYRFPLIAGKLRPWGDTPEADVKDKLSEMFDKTETGWDGTKVDDKPIPFKNMIQKGDNSVNFGKINNDMWFNLYGMAYDYMNWQKKQKRKKINGIVINNGKKDWVGDGEKMHEAGFALDMNVENANELATAKVDGKTIMEKWGFWRSGVSKPQPGEAESTYNPDYNEKFIQEPWHVEHKSYKDQRDAIIAKAKSDGTGGDPSNNEIKGFNKGGIIGSSPRYPNGLKENGVSPLQNSSSVTTSSENQTPQIKNAATMNVNVINKIGLDEATISALAAVIGGGSGGTVNQPGKQAGSQSAAPSTNTNTVKIHK